MLEHRVACSLRVGGGMGRTLTRALVHGSRRIRHRPPARHRRRRRASAAVVRFSSRTSGASGLPTRAKDMIFRAKKQDRAWVKPCTNSAALILQHHESPSGRVGAGSRGLAQPTIFNLRRPNNS